jgi:hypothetical protein
MASESSNSAWWCTAASGSIPTRLCISNGRLMCGWLGWIWLGVAVLLVVLVCSGGALTLQIEEHMTNRGDVLGGSACTGETEMRERD